MATLNWIGKDAVVNHDKEVPFKLIQKIPGNSVGKESKNLIIHGDNLEALKALMPFYKDKIKCIYIDPPYNTGSEEWVYNDKVNSPKIHEWIKKVVGREGEDLTRHDKWLCMMYPRLKLLRDLLAEDGVIFISIDDNEHSNLKLVMDEIFQAKNFVTNIVWQKSYSPVNLRKNFSPNHDFIIVYAKNISSLKLNQLSRSEEAIQRYKNPDNDSRGPWKSTDLSVGPAVKENIYEILTPKGRSILPPKGRSWVLNKKRFQEFLNDKRIWFGANGNAVPSIKKFLSEVKPGVTPMTVWTYQEVGHNQDAKREVKEILEQESPFETPKPLGLLRRILEIGTLPNDIILDSFAGSGTTGQAVLGLNKEDGGNRQFILVEMEDRIAKSVTAERIKRAIKKYEYKAGFEFCELAKPLFDAQGQINENCSYDDLATYIYFAETQTNTEKKNIKKPLIGESQGVFYYLLFAEKGKNDLTRSALTKLKLKGQAVVYADRCLIDEDELKAKGVIFKQIPYEIKVY